MKAVDRVGNALGIGSIVLCSAVFEKDDPLFDYRIIAGTNGQAGIKLLCPKEYTKKGAATEISCTVVNIVGEIMKDTNGLVVRFKNLLHAPNVPEQISTRLYQAVLHRAAKPRGK